MCLNKYINLRPQRAPGRKFPNFCLRNNSRSMCYVVPLLMLALSRPWQHPHLSQNSKQEDLIETYLQWTLKNKRRKWGKLTETPWALMQPERFNTLPPDFIFCLHMHRSYCEQRWESSHPERNWTIYSIAPVLGHVPNVQIRFFINFLTSFLLMCLSSCGSSSTRFTFVLLSIHLVTKKPNQSAISQMHYDHFSHLKAVLFFRYAMPHTTKNIILAKPEVTVSD